MAKFHPPKIPWSLVFGSLVKEDLKGKRGGGIINRVATTKVEKNLMDIGLVPQVDMEDMEVEVHQGHKTHSFFL